VIVHEQIDETAGARGATKWYGCASSEDWGLSDEAVIRESAGWGLQPLNGSAQPAHDARHPLTEQACLPGFGQQVPVRSRYEGCLARKMHGIPSRKRMHRFEFHQVTTAVVPAVQQMIVPR
jgi:hypothetical protein